MSTNPEPEGSIPDPVPPHPHASDAGRSRTAGGGLAGAIRGGTMRGARLSARAAMAVLSVGALLFILLLVGAWAWVQRGPGGMMSPVRQGRPAPDFELALLDGRLMHLSDYRGHTVAVNFWTTWCPGCVYELPALDEAVTRHAGDGLVVLAVNAGEWPADVEDFLARRSVTALTVPLDARREVFSSWKISALPTTVWLDAEGVVRDVHIGVLSADLIDDYVARLAPGGGP